jgi:hypothetical protein
MGDYKNGQPHAPGGAEAAAGVGGAGNAILPAALRGLSEGGELSAVEEYAQARLALARRPQDVIAEAKDVSRRLMEVVFEQGWARAYGGQRKKDELEKDFINRHHLTIEAWQFLARFFGVAVRVVDIQPLRIGDDHGFQATAAAVRISDGAELSRAVGMCMTDEPHWAERPKYEWDPRERRRMPSGTEPVKHSERAAMAQTRACSRVLSNLFRSVARMAGFAGTPDEEMAPVHEQAPEEPEPQGYRQPEPLPVKKGAAVKLLTQEQRRDIWAMTQELHGKDAEDALRAALQPFGYRGTAEVREKDLPVIQKAVADWSKK